MSMVKIKDPWQLRSQAPIVCLRGKLRWECLPGAQIRVLGKELPDWENLANDGRAELVKQNDLRQVWKVKLADGGDELFVKIYRAEKWSERLKWQLWGRPAEREFRLMLWGQVRKISVPKALAWAERPGLCLLITESLGEGVGLDELLDRHRKRHSGRIIVAEENAELNQALQATAYATARLHRGGMLHHDLHPGNVLIQENGAVLMDWQCVAFQPRGGHASAEPRQADRMKSLALLAASLRNYLSEAELRSFARNYIAGMRPGQQWRDSEFEQYWDKLSVLCDQSDAKEWQKRDRRCMRDTKYSRRIKLAEPGWSARVFLQAKQSWPESIVSGQVFTVEQWREALADTKNFHGKKIIKSGCYTKVSSGGLVLGGQEYAVVFKERDLDNIWINGLKMLRMSRAARHWKRAHKLVNRNIATAWPMAVLEYKRLGLMCKSILICENLGQSTSLHRMIVGEELPVKSSERWDLAGSIAAILVNLMRRGLEHHDFKASNIIIGSSSEGGFRPTLIDLDGLRKRWWWDDRFMANRTLVRLGSSIYHLDKVRMSDYGRVLHCYLRERHLPELNDRASRHKLWRMLIKRVKVRSAGSLRKYRKRNIEDSKGDYKNILIIKPSALGDVVRCLGVYYALRERWPDARISWLVRSDIAPVLRNLEGLELLEFPRKNAAGIIKLIRELPYYGFDLVLDLQGLFRSGFFAWRTGCGVRLGFENAREFAGIFYSEKIRIPEEEHISVSYGRFLSALGIETEKPYFNLPKDEPACDNVRAKVGLNPASYQADKGYVVLLIGGTEQSKRWPAERFAELAGRIWDNFGLLSVLVGHGAAEQELAAEVKRLEGEAVVDLAGQTALAEVVELLRTSRLVIGNDSGPLHIAAALGVRLVALYGPTNPAIVGPYGQNEAVIEAGKGLARQGRYSVDERHRIDNIGVDEVWDKVKGLMTES